MQRRRQEEDEHMAVKEIRSEQVSLQDACALDACCKTLYVL
jgi:hypothetical protein